MYYHPNYYKKLRMQYGPHKAISNSEENSEAASVRRGSRPQATSSKRQAPSDSSSKQQASSPKQQASSSKPQASSSMIREPRNIWKRFAVLGPRASASMNVLCGCLKWNAIWCAENFNFIPLVTFNSIVKKWPLVLQTNRSGVPRELRFSSLVNENWGQALRTFWYSLASGPTYFFEVMVSFFFDFNDASIPMIVATSP